MTTSFLLLFVGVLAALLIGRLYKSAKVYIGILLILLLGYVVGTGIKRVVANAQTMPEKQFVITASVPTNQCLLPTVVWIGNDTNIDLSQVINTKIVETDRDTVITNSPKGPTTQLITEFIDDS